MKNKRAVVILFLVIVVAILILCVNQYHRTKVYYNDAQVNGNSDGNLYNRGLFCEYDGIIYFSNPKDGGALYSMNSSGGDLTKLSDDRAWYINADEHYIYYARNNESAKGVWGLNARNEYGLIRIDKNGKNSKNLDSAPVMGVSLIGNTIYYFHYDKETATQLYQIDIDGENKKMVFDQAIWAAASDGSAFYYSGVSDDHDLHRYDTESGKSTMVLSGNYYMPMVVGQELYYLNLEEGYTLWSHNLSTGEERAVLGYRIDTYHVAGDKIYYQTAKEKTDGLYVFDLSTSTNTLLMEGVFCDLNVAGNRVYFHPFEDYDVYYYTLLSQDYVTVF